MVEQFLNYYLKWTARVDAFGKPIKIKRKTKKRKKKK